VLDSFVEESNPMVNIPHCIFRTARDAWVKPQAGGNISSRYSSGDTVVASVTEHRGDGIERCTTVPASDSVPRHQLSSVF